MIRSNRKPTPNPAVEGNGKLLIEITLDLLIVQINFEAPIILTNGVFFYVELLYVDAKNFVKMQPCKCK